MEHKIVDENKPFNFVVGDGPYWNKYKMWYIFIIKYI